MSIYSKFSSTLTTTSLSAAPPHHCLQLHHITVCSSTTSLSAAQPHHCLQLNHITVCSSTTSLSAAPPHHCLQLHHITVCSSTTSLSAAPPHHCLQLLPSLSLYIPQGKTTPVSFPIPPDLQFSQFENAQLRSLHTYFSLPTLYSLLIHSSVKHLSPWIRMPQRTEIEFNESKCHKCSLF
ncbi:hypothetical protein BgiMline_009519 [Biomphalaria glabrata]|nr:hypothetical protein BgiMline_023647 [Biomphalaria glabrata]